MVLRQLQGSPEIRGSGRCFPPHRPFWGGYGWPQNAASLPYSPGVLLNQTPAEQPPSEPENGTLNHWLGLPMHHISFEGVDPSHLDPLPATSPSRGAPLNPEDVRKSLRQLFATGLFETIEVEGVAQPDGVSLIFHGTPARSSEP